MEAQLKKRLQTFLGEMQKLGTVQGFKYFSTYLRGREEMVITVLNVPQATISECGSGPVSPQIKPDITPGSSFDSHNLPYDKTSLMMSQRTQMALSGFGDRGVGLPPASPSDEDAQARDESTTVFLLAGYTRYACPYVWVRSNHARLVRLAGGDAHEKDCPLRLKSTSKWKDSVSDMFISSILAELVKLCTCPAPRNPFEVDISYFSQLPLHDRVLATAAMATFLQKVLLHTADDKPYAGKVFEDLRLVTKCHFTAVQELAKQGSLPILQRGQQQQRKQSSSHSRPGTRQRYPSGSQYPAQYQQSAPQYAGYT